MQRFDDIQAVIQRLHALGVKGLQCDSRRLLAGDAFVAWPGAAQDGRRFVQGALASGALACVVEADGVDRFGFDDPRILALTGLKSQSGGLADVFYGQPSERLDVVAITGTNGKTSTAWWTAQLLTALGRTCANVGTLGIGLPLQGLQPTGLTTPDPVMLQSSLRRLADEGVHACAVEASSIGIAEGRLNGTKVRVAVFTNLTQDHLDYHHSMEAYWEAKRALFAWHGLRSVVINVDDSHGVMLVQELAHRVAQGESLDLWTISVQGQQARLSIRSSEVTPRGLRATVVEAGESGEYDIELPVVGTYNLYNVLSAVAVARSLGHGLQQSLNACVGLTPVPGRMQSAWPEAPEGMPLVLADYAHTPDAVEKALAALRPLAQRRGGQLWCLLGCGGDRDPGKRPLMAAAAEQGADVVLLTSDNPRSEDPLRILGQMQGGLRSPERVKVEPDRARAIAWALAQSDANDVVLLAGKGHEDYQEVAGVKRPFSDVLQARTALHNRSAHAMNGRAAQHWFEALQSLEGAQVVGDLAAACTKIQRIHTDTRTLQPGDVFVALRGERFDAHDFLPQARQAGAVAALAEQGLKEAGLPGVEVPDARLALGEWAANWRQRFALPLIAVTGSNGKTTVTQMVASILLAAVGQDALATQGNLNNDIGVPLTLLRLRDHHRLAVVELGMNHPGEIAGLAAMASPTVALVNNAQREHQEFMASVEAVARENASCFAALQPQGVAVFPAADTYTPLWRELAGEHRCLTFGADEGDVRGQAQWSHGAWHLTATTPEGSFEARLRIAGRHNVINALAATACALAAGVSLKAIAQGLDAFEPVNGRSRALSVRLNQQEVVLIDDTYNANPDSVRAAIDVLAELPGPRLLVLGDMGEVGEQGLPFHQEVIGHALARGMDRVWVTGNWMEQAAAPLLAQGETRVRFYKAYEPLESDALEVASEMGSVLVKGSRFMRMERLVQALVAKAASAPVQQEQGVSHAA